jgi:hypothetical protein
MATAQKIVFHKNDWCVRRRGCCRCELLLVVLELVVLLLIVLTDGIDGHDATDPPPPPSSRPTGPVDLRMLPRLAIHHLSTGTGLLQNQRKLDSREGNNEINRSFD